MDSNSQERKEAEEQLGLLRTITMEVAAASDLSSALEVVLHRVCETTRWALGQAWVPNAEGTLLECGPAWIAESDLDAFRLASQQSQFKHGIGLPGRVWESQQSTWIEDVRQDLNFPRANAAEVAGLQTAVG